MLQLGQVIAETDGNVGRDFVGSVLVFAFMNVNMYKRRIDSSPGNL